MHTFEPDIFYHIGTLTPQSAKNPTMSPVWSSQSTAQAKPGSELIGKYKCPDTQDFYAKNPLGLTPKKKWYIYEADPKTGVLKYIAGANPEPSKAPRKSRSKRGNAATPLSDPMATQLRDMFETSLSRMETLRDDVQLAQATVADRDREIGELKVQMMEKDRQLLELQHIIDTKDRDHEHQAALVKSAHDAELRTLRTEHERDREAIVTEATSTARNELKGQNQRTLEGIIERYEPKVRPVMDMILDYVGNRLAGAIPGNQPQQPGLPPQQPAPQQIAGRSEANRYGDPTQLPI